MWIFKNYRLTIYQLVDGNYQVSENSRYFPNLLVQNIIDSCLTTAPEKGRGIAMGEIRRALK